MFLGRTAVTCFFFLGIDPCQTCSPHSADQELRSLVHEDTVGGHGRRALLERSAETRRL